MRFFLILVCVVASSLGCDVDPCADFGGQSCIALEVDGNLSVTQLLVSAGGAFVLVDSPAPPMPRYEAVSLPVALAVLPGDHEGTALLTVKALEGDLEVGRGEATVAVKKGQRVAATVPLTANPLDLLPPPDLAPSDLNGVDLADVPCDPVTQSPCGASDRCVIVTGAKTVCRPAGALPTGALCNPKNDQCARTNQCLIPSSSGGVCEEFCGNDVDCKQAPVAVGGMSEPSNIGHCMFMSGGTSVRICSVACNPVETAGPSGCPSDAACIYSATGMIPELTFCGPPGSAGDGQDCSMGSCLSGLSCLAVNTQFHCRPVCRKNTDADCPTGYTCKPGAAGTASVMFGYCCPAAGC